MRPPLSLIVFLLAIALASCGFSPVYQSGNSIGEGVRGIRLDDPKNAIEFSFLHKLQRKIPQGGDSGALLTYNLTLTEASLVDRRVEIRGAAVYSIVDTASQQVTLTGRVTSTAGYSTSTTFSGIMANEPSRDDAIDRLTESLAQAVYLQILAKLAATRP